MDTNLERAEVDPVFLAMTRPQMAMGVTFSFFVINLMVTTVAFLVSKSFLAFFIGIPVHAAGYLLCLKDPRIFEIWQVRLVKTPITRNKSFWRANSYAP